MGADMSGKNINLYCLIGALLAATVMAIYASDLRGSLHTTQAALAQAVATAEIAQREAAMCRGMIGGQADPAWQIQVRF